MNKLFVQLAVSGLVAVGMGVTALADSANISLTGPGSTNTVTSTSGNWFNQNYRNNVGLGNWNNQWARTGNVAVRCNTAVYGGGNGSGSSYNNNYGQNAVELNNNDGGYYPSFQGGGNNGSIYLTGPYSSNRIGSNNQNQFRSNTTNNVSANNFSSQNATTGGVTISGNTLVSGVGGSGNASNENSGTNFVDISNAAPMPNFGGYDGNNASISTTGPGSYNSVGFRNNSSFDSNTSNNVRATNSNYQNAMSGPVRITGNTVVEGVGGSGSAYNSNMGANEVGISNN
jgi:hypothetical protein